jgi:hypothetical protein
MNDLVPDKELRRRIVEKLRKHDKSLFTAFELNYLLEHLDPAFGR